MSKCRQGAMVLYDSLSIHNQQLLLCVGDAPFGSAENPRARRESHWSHGEAGSDPDLAAHRSAGTLD